MRRAKLAMIKMLPTFMRLAHFLGLIAMKGMNQKDSEIKKHPDANRARKYG